MDEKKAFLLAFFAPPSFFLYSEILSFSLFSALFPFFFLHFSIWLPFHLRFFGFYRLFHLVTVGAWNLSSTAFFLIMLIEIFKAHTRFLVQGVKGKYKYKRNKKNEKNKKKIQKLQKKAVASLFLFSFSFFISPLLPTLETTCRCNQKKRADGPFWD